MATPRPLVPEHLGSPLEPRQQKQKHPARFQCNICHRRFTRAFNMHSHIRAHTGDRPYSCSQCDKSFTRQNDRDEHEKLHSGEKTFVCLGELEDGSIRKNGCGKRFARRAQLTRHRGPCTRSMIRKGEAEQQRQRTTIVIEDTPEPTAAPPISQLLTHSAPLSYDYPSSNDTLLFPHPEIRRPSPPPSTEPARPTTAAIEATPEPAIASPISQLLLAHSATLFGYPSSNDTLPFPTTMQGMPRRSPPPH
ncbi:transcription factor CRZ1 [Microdochium nivale]|nr:transcription factor CRZ1 [Microdochium nivale]